MSDDWALEELAERAKRGNLYIGTQGRSPPGPVVLTYEENGEDLTMLHLGLEAGQIIQNRRGINEWIAYDDEAIEVIIKLKPLLKGVKLCSVNNTLSEWRRAKVG